MKRRWRWRNEEDAGGWEEGKEGEEAEVETKKRKSMKKEQEKQHSEEEAEGRRKETQIPVGDKSFRIPSGSLLKTWQPVSDSARQNKCMRMAQKCKKIK